ncbi:hypothetical protein RchiOBHm_Chr1g0355601 [Rosa chinensis]|uniref:Uncharacterized protein n=1 Tax=Rosa chinensis TaxID=74649 RepID=A0A2P6SHJ1_ROSCH|nr:hypothetical protein RchiOBHm_Chr1g0355601 [Rosa chinensis]
MKTRRRLELLLEDLPCYFSLTEYYDTSDEVIELPPSLSLSLCRHKCAVSACI